MLFFRFCFIVFAALCLTQRISEAKRHKKTKGKIFAEWSLVAMVFVHFFFLFGSVIELFYLNYLYLVVVVIGIIMFCAGFFLRKWVINTLGQYWSLNVEIREDHKLITNGPYALCRHPNYLAILLEVMGFALIANAYLTLLVGIIFYSVVLFLRIKAEENAMIKKFQQTYLSYKQKTATLLPYIF